MESPLIQRMLKLHRTGQSFLGFTNYHPEYVKQYAAVASPLPELTGGQK